MLALLGAAIERGEHHGSVLERFGAGVSSGDAPRFSSDDLYPDARPALDALRERGVRVAIAGNFGARIASDVRTWDLPVEAVLAAEELGAEKPHALFFERLAAALGVAPREIVYVGDRLDNDVAAARAAGCLGVFLRRGPWALIQEPRSGPLEGLAIDGLGELEAVLPQLPTTT